MILRRFTEHIKEQNWFAVGLDVIVVVVGIFLGMQVTEWNEERQNKQIERIIIKRISAETITGLNVIDSYLAFQNDAIKRSIDFFKKLDKDGNCDLSNKEMSDGLVAVASFAPLDFEFLVLDELVQSGRVTLIADADVRSGLASKRSNLNLVNQQWNRFSRIKGDAVLLSYATAGAIIESDSSFNLANTTFDTLSFRTPEMLCRNYRRELKFVTKMET